MSQEQPQTTADRTLGIVRLAIGLVQGLALLALHKAWDAKAWPATEPALMGALILICGLLPVMILGGVAALRRRTLIIWSLGALVLLAIFGAYGILRQAPPTGTARLTLEALTVIASVAALFIGHHLIAPADQERRWIAHYPGYFDGAWKDAVQLGLSAAFVGAFWAVLFLGAQLFHVIKIDAFRDIIRKDWFAYPVTATAFAGAVHLSEVRVGLVRSVRTVGLTLLAWLMPLMALIAAAFLCALPFTGLKPLWDTRNATAVLLAACGALVVLVNAAYQDGDAERRPPLLLRHAGRVACIVLAPLVAIAIYGLSLRVGQYGWTADRIVAAACATAALCYAVGYLIAAVRPGPWLKGLERTNVAAALVVLVLIAALFTPIADPARIATADQVARLRAGKVAPDKFDYKYLRFDAGRYGIEALNALKATKAGPNATVIAAKADAALKDNNRYDVTVSKIQNAPNFAEITVYPKGSSLPAGFQDQDWTAPILCSPDNRCEAYRFDLDGDGTEEIVLAHRWAWSVFAMGADRKWSMLGKLEPMDCALRDAFRKGEVSTSPARWRDVSGGGKRASLIAEGARPPAPECPG